MSEPLSKSPSAVFYELLDEICKTYDQDPAQVSRIVADHNTITFEKAVASGGKGYVRVVEIHGPGAHEAAETVTVKGRR